MVVLGHETMFYCDFSQIVVRETNYGQFCVAFFLFMSGYGLAFGVMRNNGNLVTWNWLINRLQKLIVPALTATLLYTVARLYCGVGVDWVKLLKWWFISDVNLKYGWYVTEIILLYIIFFLCHHWWKGGRAFILLDILICLAVLFMIMTSQPVWYIVGLPCFVLGTWMARWEYKTKEHVKGETLKNLAIKVKLLMSAVVICFILVRQFGWIQGIIPILDKWRYMYISFYVANILFVVLVVYLLMRMPSCKKMLNRGGYFYEIYLVQGTTLLVCRRLTDNDFIFIPLAFIVTVFFAKWMNVVNQWCIKMWQSRF